MTIAPDSTAVEKTGKPTPPWVPPRIAVPRAYCVFEPATPYLRTLAISCQPTLLFGVVPLTQAPVSAITLPPVTTPADMAALNHSRCNTVEYPDRSTGRCRKACPGAAGGGVEPARADRIILGMVVGPTWIGRRRKVVIGGEHGAAAADQIDHIAGRRPSDDALRVRRIGGARCLVPRVSGRCEQRCGHSRVFLTVTDRGARTGS